MSYAHMDRYIRMQQYAEYRRPFVFKTTSDLSDESDLLKKFGTNLRLLHADVLFLCKDSKEKQTLYFFDSDHNKLIRFSSKEGKDSRSNPERVRNLLPGETDAIIQLLNSNAYSADDSKKIEPVHLVSIRKEQIKLPYDGFLTRTDDQASLDLTMLFQGGSPNLKDMQRFGMQGDQPNDVCFELISSFLTQNQHKRKLTITYPDFIRFSPEQTEDLQSKMKQCYALQALECKHLDFPAIDLSAFKQSYLEELAIKEDQIKLFRTMSTMERHSYFDRLFSDPSKKKERIEFMQNLQKGLYLSADVPLAPEEMPWTMEQNSHLLQRGFNKYIEATKAELAKTSTQSSVGLTAVLRLSEELVLIGGHQDPPRLTSINNELNERLQHVMDHYKKQNFRSEERKNQLALLQLNLSPDNKDSYRVILNHLHDAKINTLQQDSQTNQERQKHWFWKHFLVNRSGKSRFLDTLNKMHDEVLNHWLQNLKEGPDALHYYEYITEDFKTLMAQFKTISAQYPDFALLAKNLNPDASTSMNDINALLSAVKNDLDNYPNELKTIANEVLLRGEPLLNYLKEQDSDMNHPNLLQ